MRGAWVVVMTLLIVGTAPPVAAKPLYDEPVYFPERKAYFELVRIPPGYSNRGPGAPAANWQNTRKLAAQRVYRGLRGRLAVVDSPELSAFLRKTFDPRGNAWIGLRYFCQLGRLVGSTAEVGSRTAGESHDLASASLQRTAVLLRGYPQDQP